MICRALQFALGLFFVPAGVLHFLNPSFYLRMMPPQLPFPLELVYLSGAAEILFGVLVLIEKTRRPAAWGLVALLAAVFPANLYLAFHPEIFPGVPPLIFWIRLPFQALFVFWVLPYTKPDLYNASAQREKT